MTFGICVVLYNLYNIQIKNFTKYQSDAIQQQTSETAITPKRGTIYDRNMKILASSTSVERVFISPAELTILPKKIDATNKEEYEADEQTDTDRYAKAARLTAEGLSQILGVDYNFVADETKKTNRKDETIKKDVDITTANQVRQFAADNRIKGIYFQPDTKRVYPFSNMASSVIGFTGSDNNGLFGIEYQYDDYLKGVPGKIITARDGMGNVMGSEYETYVDAQNGSNLVLTIDWTIQSILEKYMDEAFAEAQPKQRVTGIVMDVSTGEILAMSTKPDYDLNNPYNADPDVMKYINLDPSQQIALDAKTFDSPEAKQKETDSLKLLKLWSNKAITEPYEPGSTFKVITAATALEEKVVTPTDMFYCPGYWIVAGQRINCYLLSGHGHVTFARGLEQSCNPTLMQTIERIGAPTFYKYFTAFGYTEKTGIDLPGEAMSIYHTLDDLGPVELATSSFGQTFKVTPIQQITGIAAVANGGKLVTPHLVKEIIDDQGNVIKSFDTEIRRTVLSQETCKTLTGILVEGVATDGAARNAYVKGYNVAGKTGTSQKRGPYDDPNARIGSCIAFAPQENPQVAVMIIVDEPTQGSIYGGTIAAPFVSKAMSEILPYLGVEPNYTPEEIAERQVIVKDYRTQKVSSAESDITSLGLTYTIEGNGDLIRDQIPKAGSSLVKGGNIILYTDGSKSPDQTLVAVPNVLNLTVERANKTIIDANLNINIVGAENSDTTAESYNQDPAPNTQVPLGTIITVEFRHNVVDGF